MPSDRDTSPDAGPDTSPDTGPDTSPDTSPEVSPEVSPDAVDVQVRVATLEDADALATVFLDAREAAYPEIPRPVHPPDDVRRWVRSRVEAAGDGGVEVWLAAQDAEPVALLLLEDAWVHSLYVAPGRTGQGIGTVLLDLAKSLRPEGLGLWVFETNAGAQRFYRRHGFGEVRRTDGSDNEEQQPDLELAWPDPDSVAGIRRRIDVLDDRLAGLLAERARLTARVQRVKAVPGHAGRDREREAAIVARMTALAPALGDAGLARIMDAVIGASLDAAETDDREQDRGTPGPVPDPSRGEAR